MSGFSQSIKIKKNDLNSMACHIKCLHLQIKLSTFKNF